MQRSVLAIMQSTNLYSFGVNNPIMFTDPLGLNVPEENWFPIRSEVEAVGGTVGWDNGTVTVNIGGFTGSFQVGSDGVELRPYLNRFGNQRRDGWRGELMYRTYVRSDIFNSQMFGDATEAIFLSGHPAFVRVGANPLTHTFTIMMVTPDSAYYGTTNFTDNDTILGNIRFATIGGTGEASHTRGLVNSRTDRNFRTNRFIQHLYTGTGMVTRLFNAYNHFSQNHDESFSYNARLGFTGDQFNSNSYNRGMLQSLGLAPFMPLNINAPGWENPIPNWAFGN